MPAAGKETGSQDQVVWRPASERMTRAGAIKGSRGHIAESFMSLHYRDWKLCCGGEEPLEDLGPGVSGNQRGH